MLQIYVDGASDARAEDEIKRIVDFGIHHLIDGVDQNRLTVFIKIEPKKSLPKGVVGETRWCDDPTNPKEFEILLASGQRQERKIRTIFHEMVHVKQLYFGELVDCPGEPIVFRNRKFPDDLEWVSQPWELEAISLEANLYFEWKFSRDET